MSQGSRVQASDHTCIGRIAQLVERWSNKPDVPGSNPVTPKFHHSWPSGSGDGLNTHRVLPAGSIPGE